MEVIVVGLLLAAALVIIVRINRPEPDVRSRTDRRSGRASEPFLYEPRSRRRQHVNTSRTVSDSRVARDDGDSGFLHTASNFDHMPSRSDTGSYDSDSFHGGGGSFGGGGASGSWGGDSSSSSSGGDSGGGGGGD